MVFGSEAATKFVKPGEVTGIFWESRAKYEEEVEKVVKLIQALDEIRAKTINAETAKTADTTLEWLSALEWIQAKIDQIIEPLPASKGDSGLDVKLSLDRFNALRKAAEPFWLKPAEVSRRGREHQLGSEVVSNWSSLESLQVEGTGGKEELDLRTLPKLPKLGKLELINCGLTSLDLPTARLPNMWKLSIANNPELDLQSFPTLPKLDELILSNCGITTLASLTSDRLPALGNLACPNNPGLVLSTLPDSPTLHHLSIANCNVKTLEHLTATRFPDLAVLHCPENEGLTRDTLPEGHRTLGHVNVIL